MQNIRVLCAAYGVTDERVIERLVTLAREARRPGWWTKYPDVFRSSFVGLEAEASAITTFELALIPGLLQTADYMRAIMRGARIEDPAEIERRIEARLERQRILTRANPPRYWAIIDEAALIRSLGDREAHRRQLRRLVDTGPMEHVTVQVLPLSAGPHPGLSGSFVILDFPEECDRSVVYQETATASHLLEEQEDIDRYTALFRQLCDSALPAEDSIAYLSALADRL